MFALLKNDILKPCTAVEIRQERDFEGRRRVFLVLREEKEDEEEENDHGSQQQAWSSAHLLPPRRLNRSKTTLFLFAAAAALAAAAATPLAAAAAVFAACCRCGRRPTRTRLRFRRPSGPAGWVLSWGRKGKGPAGLSRGSDPCRAESVTLQRWGWRSVGAEGFRALGV